MEKDPKAETPAAPGPEQPPALLVCSDLMFLVQLQNMARKCGFVPASHPPGNLVERDAGIMVVDLSSRGDWEASIRSARERGIPVLAFGPHMDAEGRRRARDAGAARVLANSNLTRDLPRMLLAISGSTTVPVETPHED